MAEIRRWRSTTLEGEDDCLSLWSFALRIHTYLVFLYVEDVLSPAIVIMESQKAVEIPELRSTT